MQLARRKVRSAGRTSGSVEITLPVEVQLLEGIECDILLRDGVTPEIVMQPDLTVAQGLFIELWHMLRVGLGAVGDIGDFSLDDFSVGLLPPRYWHDRPPLSYQDALEIQSCLGRELPSEQIQQSGALHRLVTFLVIGAAFRLGLKGRLAVSFGDAVAYLVTGVSGGHGSEFEQQAALEAFGQGKLLTAGRAEALSIDTEWQGARDGLARVHSMFADWQERPEEYQTAKERAWRRAIRVEAGTSISTVESYLRRGTLRS